MSEDRLIHSFGRRRGRKLRAGRAALLDTALPALRVSLPEGEATLDPAAPFAGAAREIWLEIGFGGGEHLASQAAANPQVGLIGCEPYENGVVALLGHLRDRGLGNVRVWPDDARPLLERLEPGRIARAFVLFPDPWPKARHHKRRIVQPEYATLLATLVRPGGFWHLATDIADYAEQMLEVLSASPEWSGGVIERPSYRPITKYESIAIEAGRPITDLLYTRV